MSEFIRAKLCKGFFGKALNKAVASQGKNKNAKDNAGSYSGYEIADVFCGRLFAVIKDF